MHQEIPYVEIEEPFETSRLALWLKKNRESLGLSYDSLSEYLAGYEIKLSKVALFYFEHDDRVPSVELLKLLNSVLPHREDILDLIEMRKEQIMLRNEKNAEQTEEDKIQKKEEAEAHSDL